MKTRYATRSDIPELVRIINIAYRVEDFFVDGDRTSVEVVNLHLELPPFYAKFGFESNGTAVFTDIEKLKRDAYLNLMTKSLSGGAT